jgi:hypothetical protein
MINPRRVVSSFPLSAILFLALIQALPLHAQEQQPPDNQLGQPSQSPASQPPSAQSSSPQQQPPSSQSAEEDKKKSQAENQPIHDDRLGFVLPNFLTVENAGKIPPLTAKQKFAIVARSSFDWAQYFWYGALAGISQAQNSEPGYGQGAEGYGKRYGAALADGTIENFWTSAIFPSLLREDPRYFQMGKGSFWRRTRYAVSRIVVTRTDSGNSQFNFSEFLGSAMAAGISTYSYHPHADKTLSNTASVWGTQVAYDSLSYFVKEFWPDIRRKLKRQNN